MVLGTRQYLFDDSHELQIWYDGCGDTQAGNSVLLGLTCHSIETLP